MKNNGKDTLQLTPLQAYTVYDFVSYFKQAGASFDKVFRRLPGIEDSQAFLCDMLGQLKKPENSQLNQVFEETLVNGDRAHLLLVRDKAWTMAKKWQNPSETSGATEVSFIAKVLSLDLAGNEQKVPYEQQAKLDDEADGILEQLGTREDGNEDSQQHISTQLDDETPTELTMEQKIYEAEQDMLSKRTQRIFKS